jgi:hypothetical protein
MKVEEITPAGASGARTESVYFGKLQSTLGTVVVC